MKEIFESVDISVVIQLALLVLIYLFLRYGKGLVSDSVYTDVKTALTISGALFRSDKIKAITDVASDVVKTVETLDKTNEEKHEEAVNQIAAELYQKYGIKYDKQMLDTLVKITVSYLPKTH